MINRTTFLSTLSAFVALLGLVLAAKVNAENAHTALPSVSTALPSFGSDVPPPAAVDLPETIQASPVVIAARPPMRAKTWVCGAPHGLANDATQTVRDCEYR